MPDAHHQTYSKSCKSYNKNMKMVLSYFMFNSDARVLSTLTFNS